jgi:hypothetical protein
MVAHLHGVTQWGRTCIRRKRPGARGRYAGRVFSPLISVLADDKRGAEVVREDTSSLRYGEVLERLAPCLPNRATVGFRARSGRCVGTRILSVRNSISIRVKERGVASEHHLFSKGR